MKARILLISWLLSFAFTCKESWGEIGIWHDPFKTQKLISPSPDKKNLSGADPCRLNNDFSHAWTLVEIIDHALCHNPQTRQAWANARFQAGQVGIAKSAYLPTVTLNTSISRSVNSGSGNLQINAIGAGGGSAQPLTRITPILSLNLLVYNFGAREAQLENAQKTLEASNWTHDAILQSIMFSTIQAYYQVFATQSAAEAALISEEASAAALKAAELRYDVGTVAFADALLAKTAFAQAKLTHQKSAGDAKIAVGTLANALGLDADYSLNIAAPPLQEPDAAQDAIVHQLIDEAKSLRPDLAAAEANVKAAQANVKALELGRLPSVSLIANYGFNHTSLPSDTQSWTIGMQISVPLFTGFNRTYQIESAKAQLEAQQASYDQIDQSVSLDVWRAYQLLNTARESLNSSKELLASADQSERVAMGRYQSGVGNIIDLLNAQASHANARLQFIQSQYNWLTQKAQLAKALGRLDFSSIPVG